jgi:hypothetical protein
LWSCGHVSAEIIHHLDSAADPAHDVDRHRIAQRLVALTICGDFPAERDQRIVVRESLQPLALARRQPTDRDQAAVAVEVRPEPATACRARANCWGNSFPRLSARRRMPLQAFALKKYRCGTSPVSKMSDNEHTPSSLRDSPSKAVHSHVLSVKHSPARTHTRVRPSLRGRHQNPVLLPTTGRRGRSPKPATRAYSGQRWQDRRGRGCPRVSQSLAKSSDRERLAGRSSDENIDSCIRPVLEFGHVSPIGNVGVMVGEHGRRKRLDFGKGDRRQPSGCQATVAASIPLHTEIYFTAPPL